MIAHKIEQLSRIKFYHYGMGYNTGSYLLVLERHNYYTTLCLKIIPTQSNQEVK